MKPPPVRARPPAEPPPANVPAAEPEQRRELVRMKRLATGLLLLMAAVFVATHLWHDAPGWAGYVRAFAEAAMVGALADWFAVTALFRRPLGLPIPHTAIIPNRKDQIGESLARFVRENFLTREALSPRLAELDLAARAGEWLKRPGNARRVAGDATGLVSWVLSAVDDAALKAFVRDHLHMSLRSVQVTPLIGRIMDLLLASDRHQRLMDAAVRIAGEQLTENRFRIRLKIRSESPWWLPKFVDEEIYDRIVGEMAGVLERIGTDEHHEARIRFTLAVQEFVESLKTDPDMIARGEKLKDEVLGHPAVQAWLGEIWSRLSGHLLAEAGDPESATSTRLEQAVITLGDALLEDMAVRGQIDQWIRDAVIHVAERYGIEISSVISETVRAWDGEATSRRVELQVGRDLQFIRINGTLVGGLAGLAIYLAVQWL